MEYSPASAPSVYQASLWGGPGNKAKVLGNCNVNIERLGSGVALSSLHVM